MELESRVEAFVRRHGLIAPGGRVVVACSGGPDSLALASVLLSFREKWRLSLRIAHFEHGIRGEASLADAEFVRAFAEAKGLPFDVVHEDIPACAKHARLSLETAARERRYEFLETAARKMGNGALIATGHHAGDQAETVLMHLLRGSGIDGIAGMRPRAGNRIRPLLFLTREEILAYLEAKGLTPRWDETNLLPDAARNRIRLEVLPSLRSYSPTAEAALCRFAETGAEVAEFLRDSVNEVWDKAVTEEEGVFFLRKEIYRARSAALRKAILRRLAEEAGLRQSLEFSHYEALDGLCLFGETGKRLTLPDHCIAECRHGVVALRRAPETPVAWDETELSLTGWTRIEAIGLTVYASTWSEGAALPDASTAWIDVDALKLPLSIRRRRDGDAFRLEGNGRQKVKSLLIDRKVPRALRDRVPVFTAGGEIFWVGGLRRAAVALVTKETKRAVVLRMVWDDMRKTKGETGHDDR